ncbi:hypothetical protein NEHOM01_0295 [Nematocida homosporus]|uniref:uncharacterized protein n=1 Tax=Nematocida homosporus TaxID=1912981 RepID=UPI002220FBAF|nr:uncharacterized protein NEHOM01_0295 [Nematocida homosporus]KAI5184620.1 hypothetical protein NEHOM01_0295 [Nematocida homosporus]
MDRVQVFLRIKGKKSDTPFSFTDRSILDSTTIYEFDQVFYGPDQSPVYSSISSLVKLGLNGTNVTIFAYGQTGSGKTYTMEGTTENQGVIPRAIEEVFAAQPCKVHISMVEIYNEKVADVLCPENVVNVREDKLGVGLEPLTLIECTDKSQALAALTRGSANRKTDSNGVNSASSRSHLIVTLHLSLLANQDLLTSKITLVDLAGSEKIESSSEEYLSTKKHRPERYLETATINKSLLYLSRIIYALSSPETRSKHINYRDSKLTFILRDSLNGFAKLAIIGAINLENLPETRNTLKFLNTAKQVKLGSDRLQNELTMQKLIAQIQYLNTENIRLQQALDHLKAPGHPLQAHISTTDSLTTTLEHLLDTLTNLEHQVDQISQSFQHTQTLSNTFQKQLFTTLCQYRESEIENLTNFPS